MIALLPAASGSKAPGSEVPVHIAITAGMEVVVDVPALHHNPRYWEDPTQFKPSRFLKADWPRDAFVPFSSGLRSCVGRRFAETEAMTVLTMLVSRYKISTNPDHFKEVPGELPMQRRERLLKAEDRMSLTPVKVPLLFTRR